MKSCEDEAVEETEIEEIKQEEDIEVNCFYRRFRFIIFYPVNTNHFSTD